MDIQVDYFNITRKQIDKLLGPSKAKEYVTRRSIFSVTIGSNDFLNNYLLPVISVGARISQSPDAFVDDMLNHLRGQLTVSKQDFYLKLIDELPIVCLICHFLSTANDLECFVLIAETLQIRCKKIYNWECWASWMHSLSENYQSVE